MFLSESLLEPRVRKIGKNYYHLDGLCPTFEEGKMEFQVPCVYSKTKWVKRQLLSKKKCLMRDIPPLLLEKLTNKQIETIAREK